MGGDSHLTSGVAAGVQLLKTNLFIMSAGENAYADEKSTVMERAMRKSAAEVQHFNTKEAVAFLNIIFYGQPITAGYRAKCAAVLWHGLNEEGINDVHRRLEIITHVVEEHIQQKLEKEPRWTYDILYTTTTGQPLQQRYSGENREKKSMVVLGYRCGRDQPRDDL
ncbi:unnamed protein product [Parnassius apollo]|uniref:(apollo) hypothetical protein n=1 Tax=Parnassius apollo TaxID=110799 RepID=A0A8S3YAR9_PARAO|nr:unnamed protein product [Parnassius apollo]